MQLLPKKPFTWILIIVIIYGYFEFKNENPDIDKKEEVYNPKTQISISSDNENASVADRSAAYVIKKLSENETGKAVVKAFITKSIEKQHGKKDISIINAQTKNKIITLDKVAGQGGGAFCGSRVTVNYKLFTEHEIEFDSSKQPTTFTIGGGKYIKGFENGIIGMKKGGVRKIASPSSYAYDDPNFSNDLVSEGSPVIIEVELIDIDNPLPENFSMIADVVEKGEGDNKVLCGDKVKLTYKINEKLKNLEFIVGKQNLPRPLEMGVIEMKVGEVRRLSIPAYLLDSVALKKQDADFEISSKDIFTIQLKLVELK